MLKISFITLLMLLASCGGFKLWEHQGHVGRHIASVSVQDLMGEEIQSFSDEIDERVHSLHSYYIIGQKNLYEFDKDIQKSKLVKLYERRSYLHLLSVRTQVDEIEAELKELYSELKNNKSKISQQKLGLLKERLEFHGARSKLVALSLENLFNDLGLPVNSAEVDEADITKEYENLLLTKEFSVFEKNIEHLSHVRDLSIRNEAKKFNANTSESGNITGQEFPSKVWSLTFENGPDREISPLILKNLISKELKATFFQVADKVIKSKKTATAIRDAGMEIASNSYSHKELTKVGGVTMEKEIILATQSIKENLKISVQFYRLPYGAGVKSPSIREMMAKDDLIHVFWNVDSLDWMAQSPDRIVARTIALMKKTPKDAGVILFHDTHKRTVEASLKVMDFLKTEDRRVCTLGKIVNDMNEGSEAVCSKN